MTPLPPGSTIGILGGGQLGRMLCVAAAQLGYRTHILAPDHESVAAQTAASFTRADYHNRVVLADFANGVDVVTYEFENIDVGPVEFLATRVPVHPSPAALRIAQDRAAEKGFVEGLGGRVAPWRRIASSDDLHAALAAIGAPAILKTQRFGYDGKGQVRIANADEAGAAWDSVGGAPGVIEGVVAFEHEFSVLTVRGTDGATRTWDVPDNIHEDGILRWSRLPAPPVVQQQIAEATALSRLIVEELDYVGVLACEFFAGPDGPVFNEMAPRVHNSGHWTIEGAVISQFENHIRAICGLPLGDTTLTAPMVEMENLIGDDGDRWPALFADDAAHVHFYGKDARPGRKMGHVTRLGR